MDWENFKLGPDTAIVKVKEEDSEDVDDLDSPF